MTPFESTPVTSLVEWLEDWPHAPATVVVGERRIPCLVSSAPGALVLEPEGGVIPVGPLIVEIDAGRYTWQVAGRVSASAGGALSVGLPESASRRDRRRFERVTRPGSGYSLKLVGGPAVALIDVSPNGAAFRDASGRTWAVGERVEVEIALRATAPAAASFEVRALTDDSGAVIVHGRFHPPDDSDDEELSPELLDALRDLLDP